MKHPTPYLLVFLVFSLFGHSQSLFPYKNGKLQGDFSIYDSTNQTKISGSFDNNVRIGEWVVKDASENVIYKRAYTSYQNYREIRSSSNEGVVLNYKHAIERNADGNYIYPNINDNDVSWSKRVWSILPEKHHGQLYSQEVLMKINDWVKKGKVKVYQNDEMSKLILEEDFNVSNQKIEGVTLKKDYYYDKKNHLMQKRIVAITFHLESDGTGGLQTFSIYYPTDGRILLSSFNVQNKSEQIKQYDDLFFFNDYVDIIYNEENAYGRKVDLDFSNIEQYQQVSNEIKALILKIEHRLWLEG